MDPQTKSTIVAMDSAELRELLAKWLDPARVAQAWQKSATPQDVIIHIHYQVTNGAGDQFIHTTVEAMRGLLAERAAMRQTRLV
jgi:hypothetical protein